MNLQILNERPEGMSFPDYKKHLKSQKAQIKQYKKGRLVYLAHEIKTFTTMEIDYTKTFKYPPFVGDTHSLKFI